MRQLIFGITEKIVVDIFTERSCATSCEHATYQHGSTAIDEMARAD